MNFRGGLTKSRQFASPLVPLVIRPTKPGRLSTFNQLVDPAAEDAEVVGREARGAGVVRRVVAQQGQRLAVARLHAEDRHVGVGRPGPLDGVGVLIAGVHLRLVVLLAAERIRRRGAGLHEEAAAEDVGRIVADGPADPRRLEALLGRGDRLGDLAGQELGIVRVGIGAQAAGDRRGRMGMRGRDQHAVGPDARLAARPLLGLVQQRPAESRSYRPRRWPIASVAVVEHQARQWSGSVTLSITRSVMPPLTSTGSFGGVMSTAAAPARNGRSAALAAACANGERHEKDESHANWRHSTPPEPGLQWGNRACSLRRIASRVERCGKQGV